MKITEALIAEHGVFHGLFDHIEKMLPKLKTLAEVKAVAGILEAAMEPHAKVEDELFMEPLEHCFQQMGQSETFHDEHEEIEKQLGEIRRSRDLKKARRLLLGVVTLSRQHFDKEERIVFPMAERVLKSKTLNSLGNEWLKRREATVW